MDRTADSGQQIEIVVFEEFVSVERQPDGSGKPLAGERDVVALFDSLDTPADVGFGELQLFLRYNYAEDDGILTVTLNNGKSTKFDVDFFDGLDQLKEFAALLQK